MHLHRNNYLGTEKCGLCRLKLPWDDLSSLDPWESTFRAALRLDSDENVIKITDPTNFSNGHDGQVDMTLSGSQRTQLITIISWTRRNHRKDTHATAFCFHDFCYSFLKWRVGSCTNSEIYQFARTLSLDSVAWENAYGECCPSGSMTKRTFANLANNNPYSLDLFPMSRLPVEIRNIIWGYVDFRTAAGAFTIVTGETFRLACSLNCPSHRNVSLDQGSQISLKTISVFGTSYIQAFENGESSKTIPGIVKRLSFVMVLGGICAIKLFGADWEMDWLGKIPITGRIWYGTIPEIGSSLTCSYNDLYCTRISSSGSTTNQILWDQPNIPTSLSYPEAVFLGLDYDVPDPIQNPEPSCFGYLPLFNGNEHVIGLTVYFTGNGIVGLEAHFIRTSQLSGSRDGCPKYFPLDSNERIAFAWCRVASHAHAAPALLIKTTLERTYLFGAYILPALVRSNKYKWILLGTSGYVTGFYFEKPTITPSIRRLGVTRGGNSRPSIHPTPHYIACKPPYLPSVGPDSGLFLSVAILSGLKRVELCRLGSRYTGIMIHYFKTPSVVLGQWHTSHLSRHTSINVPNASTVHFELSKSGGHQVVSNITFSADKSRDSNHQTFSVNEPIAWWFSKFDDVVCS